MDAEKFLLPIQVKKKPTPYLSVVLNDWNTEVTIVPA